MEAVSFQHVTIDDGGWNLSGGFVTMTSNAKARAAFVRNLTTYVRTHRLQGADVDWEHPKGAAQEFYIANQMRGGIVCKVTERFGSPSASLVI